MLCCYNWGYVYKCCNAGGVMRTLLRNKCVWRSKLFEKCSPIFKSRNFQFVLGRAILRLLQPNSSTLDFAILNSQTFSSLFLTTPPRMLKDLKFATKCTMF